MKCKFLVHTLNHTVLLVDITPIGLPTEVYPKAGKRQELTSLRFQTWQDAQDFLRGLGADLLSLEQAHESVKKLSVAVFTI
jgi:hypothetical protein